MPPMLRSLCAIGVVASTGCAPMQPTLPDPNADVGLGDIALLVWTTRSPSGLLGHAYDAKTGKVDAHRKVVDGPPRETPTSQRLVMVSAQTLAAEGEAGTVGFSANAKVDRATHVAYDVRVSGYLELSPDDSKYLPGCGCCQGGGVAESCGDRYVTRLIRGSGKVQHLRQLEVSAGVAASELVKARGGTTYRLLNQTEFEDSFFAYQLEPLRSLCGRLAPEDELETLAVKAPNNCWVQAHQEDGARESRAWHVPDAVLCRKLAEHHCKKRERTVACTASFGSEGQVAPLPLFEDAAVLVPAATPSVAPTPAPPPAP
jgi:hypothetical protein